MYKLVIGIPTYKRPFMLEKLLRSINDSKIDQKYIRDINIIIVDNDIDGSALNIVNKLKDSQGYCYTMAYYNYPVKGLSFVRNRLLKLALELSPDFIVSCDDDQVVSTHWLNNLIQIIVKNKGDIALGPVIPIFESKTPDSVAHWYQRKDFRNNQRVEYFHSGGTIISVRFLLMHNMKYDERFNTTGGEDTYFGLIALKNGANIYWAKEAIIYETVPQDRIGIFWIIKRRYMGAINFVYILKIERENIKILKKTLISVGYIISGSIALLAMLLPIKKRYWGIIKISEGIGGLAGLFNISYDAY